MHTLNCRGKLLDLSTPVVMGILNLTPDSFFDGGRYTGLDAALKQSEKMLGEGAVMLDLGGVSTRPGAQEVSEAEELKRVIPVIEAISRHFPGTILSVDTWRSRVAREAWNAGAAILNDVSAGAFDESLFETVAGLNMPYILMHMQGTPAIMQQHPHYEDVVTEVLDFFIEKIRELHAKGVYEIVLDPGFGFGKTVAHNFTLLKHLADFSRVLQLPVLAGISRKSMICKTLGVKPEQALNGTTALHMVALQNGASILRAHDVKEAVEVVKLFKMI